MPHPIEKGHFTPYRGNCPDLYWTHCRYTYVYYDASDRLDLTTLSSTKFCQNITIMASNFCKYNYIWSYLQMEFDIIVMVILLLSQNLMDDEIVKSFKPRKG